MFSGGRGSYHHTSTTGYDSHSRVFEEAEKDLDIRVDAGVKQMLRYFGYSSPKSIVSVTEENVASDLENFVQDLRSRDTQSLPLCTEEMSILHALGLTYGTRKQLFSGQKRQIQVLATYSGKKIEQPEENTSPVTKKPRIYQKAVYHDSRWGEEEFRNSVPSDTPAKPKIYQSGEFDVNIVKLLEYFGYTSSKVLEQITEENIQEDLRLFTEDIRAYQSSTGFNQKHPVSLYTLAQSLGLTSRNDLFSGQKCQLQAITALYQEKRNEPVGPGENNTDSQS